MVRLNVNTGYSNNEMKIVTSRNEFIGRKKTLKETGFKYGHFIL
jgi:hypothetical protein